MAVTMDVDNELDLAIGTADGKLDLDDMEEIADLLWTHPDRTSGRVMWDLRKARFSLTADEVRDLAGFAKERSQLPQPARMAFVVSHDLEFGLLRMFAAFREEPGMKTAVFRCPAEALGWLKSCE